MRKKNVRLGCIALAALMVMSFVPPAPACTFKSPLMPFEPQVLDASAYESKFNQFMVILDASASMGEYITLENWYSKFKIAKEIVDRFNQTFPEVEVDAALRTFGHDKRYSTDRTKLVLAPALYNTQTFDAALQPIGPPGGHSPLAEALDAAGEDYAATTGKIALIIFSDGKDMKSGPLKSVQKLRETFGDRLCIFPVLVGQDAAGRRMLEQMIENDPCAVFANAQDLQSGPAMADFIKNGFLQARPTPPPPPPAPPAPPAPPTPPVIIKPPAPPVLDSDGDGITDDKDRCPNTPKGARVNAQGCWVTGVPLFDFDKSVIKTKFHPDMDEVAGILLKNPKLKVRIDGHTCSLGPQAYNMGLSKRRAEAARQYLIKKGVGPERLTIEGYGPQKPVASNKTREGRHKNRRIEFSPVP